MRKIIIVLLMVTLAIGLSATTYKVALKDIPSAKYYEALLTEIGIVTGNTFEIKRYPQARAVYMLKEGKVDMEGPELSTPDNDLFLSKVEISRVKFVMYSATVMQPKDAKKLLVDPSNAKVIGMPASPATSVIGAMKSVNSGAFDGYIAAQTVGDPVLASLPELKLVKNLFGEYPVVFGLRDKHSELEKVLSEGVMLLKKSGKYKEIMGNFNAVAIK